MSKELTAFAVIALLAGVSVTGHGILTKEFLTVLSGLGVTGIGIVVWNFA